MDRKEEFLKPGERLDDLQNGYWMIQNPSLFCYGIDAVLLASAYLIALIVFSGAFLAPPRCADTEIYWEEAVASARVARMAYTR